MNTWWVEYRVWKPVQRWFGRLPVVGAAATSSCFVWRAEDSFFSDAGVACCSPLDGVGSFEAGFFQKQKTERSKESKAEGDVNKAKNSYYHEAPIEVQLS